MVPRHTVQALEALAHVRSSGSQIDSRCSSPAEHAQTPSSTRTNCSRAPVSNPRPTSIRRPPLSTTASALPVAAMGAGAWPETSTASRALRPAGACRARRFRYRLRLLNDKPRSRQNSLRLNPLDSYSAINCSTSCRLRRRRISNTCFSFMSLLHHQFHHSNRWFPLTLTLQGRECKLKYRFFAARDNLLYLAATGTLPQNDMVFKVFYRVMNTYIAELDAFTIVSFMKASLAVKSELEKENQQRLIEGLRRSDPRVQAVVDEFIHIVMDALRYNSPMLNLVLAFARHCTRMFSLLRKLRRFKAPVYDTDR